MISVGRNVFLSAVANLANQLVRTAQQLIWVPLFLMAFGKEGYGEWLTLFGLAGYVAIADLGVQTYWLNLLTGAYVREELESYRRLFRSGILLFALVGGATFLTAAGFAFFWGPARALQLKSLEPSLAAVVFLMLVGSTLLTVLMNMIRGIFRTVGQNPKVVWFGVTRDTLTLALVAAALATGCGPLGLGLVYAVSAVLMLVWVAVTLRRRFPEMIDFHLTRTSRPVVLGLVGGGSIQLVGAVSGFLLVQGTLILTNWAMGAAAVALVATTRTIANLVRQAAGSVYVAALPEFSRLDAAGDKESMERLLRRSMSFVLMLSGMACVVLVGVGPRLFQVWTRGQFPGADALIYLFAASVMIDALRMPLHDFLLGCNKIAWASLADIVYAVLSLGVMWALFPALGAWSVPISTIICGVAIHLPAVSRGSERILSRGFIWRLLARNGLGMLVSAASVVPLVLLASAGVGFELMLLATAVGLAFFCTASLLFLLDREDLLALRALVLRVARSGMRS
jgi:O-antigen/teichoic acid export membrane protein